MVSDEEILETLEDYLKLARENSMGIENGKIPCFSHENLVGKAIEDVRTIKNPLPYNVGMESPNPEGLQVLVYDDDSYLLNMRIGWQDGTTIHSFLVEDGKIRYSHHLYG